MLFYQFQDRNRENAICFLFRSQLTLFQLQTVPDRHLENNPAIRLEIRLEMRHEIRRRIHLPTDQEEIRELFETIQAMFYLYHNY